MGIRQVLSPVHRPGSSLLLGQRFARGTLLAGRSLAAEII